VGQITGMAPRSGPTTGGTLVVIQGRYFQALGEVLFLGPNGTTIGPCVWADGVGSYSKQLIRLVGLAAEGEGGGGCVGWGGE
jgi:hypothetical protein